MELPWWLTRRNLVMVSMADPGTKRRSTLPLASYSAMSGGRKMSKECGRDFVRRQPRIFRKSDQELAKKGLEASGVGEAGKDETI